MHAWHLGSRDSKVHYFSPQDDGKRKQIFVIEHESRGQQQMTATSVTRGSPQPCEGYNGPCAPLSNPSFFPSKYLDRKLHTTLLQREIIQRRRQVWGKGTICIKCSCYTDKHVASIVLLYSIRHQYTNHWCSKRQRYIKITGVHSIKAYQRCSKDP